jgi:hypothetical protein
MPSATYHTVRSEVPLLLDTKLSDPAADISASSPNILKTSASRIRICRWCGLFGQGSPIVPQFSLLWKCQTRSGPRSADQPIY